ncbi:plasmid stability protein StbD, antitoxin of toxin-antitoxin stability system [Pseudomonas sp. 21]|uniref:type II toxin-antitoxin system Phd/YefM family antitoxin n=1 Tax=unclassified Pseudomonas TaxID=196821 RepID=UPI0005EBD2A4|nr:MULTISPECIES: type II toxin-antitoxin system Phd/YefM family antitoxin [unclassified Pseudomonas]KJK01222.1 plasmid stability protein StbD, antitoxin of toxin-antitoxin stability system [Pseudomonas sp. 21]MBV7582158.1 type II toxin-antitoxin system Phd/YefM family antitoxin [Pseudomonas sp. PDM33]
MAHAVLADVAASITELKKDPMGTIEAGHGKPVVILNRNAPAFYAVPPDVYEQMLEALDDAFLARIVRERSDEPSREITLDGL